MNEQHELPINHAQSESWKDIRGFGGDYQISNLRRIKGVKRLVARTGERARGDMSTVPERIKAKRINAAGEERVVLSRERKEICFDVDHLMDQEFGSKAMATPLYENERTAAATVEEVQGGDVVTWKPIRLYGGAYEISSDRRVRSVDRSINRDGCAGPVEIKGKELKIDNKGAFPCVTLSKRNRPLDWDVDALWEQAFGSGEIARPRRPHGRVRHKSKPARSVVRTVAPMAAKSVAVDAPVLMAPVASKMSVASTTPDYVPRVFKRHWQMSKGRKDFIPDEGLRNIAAEFGTSFEEVKAIVYFHRYQWVTEKLLDELTNA